MSAAALGKAVGKEWCSEAREEVLPGKQMAGGLHCEAPSPQPCPREKGTSDGGDVPISSRPEKHAKDMEKLGQ